jgi:hypothetical protein
LGIFLSFMGLITSPILMGILGIAIFS